MCIRDRGDARYAKLSKYQTLHVSEMQTAKSSTENDVRTMSEDADDHAPVSLIIPPEDRQLTINIWHFHQDVTDMHTRTQ